jgi:hypothetical protein
MIWTFTFDPESEHERDHVPAVAAGVGIVRFAL